VTREKAFGFLDEAIAAKGPFFLGIAPVAPHSNVHADTSDLKHIKMTAPITAERHKHLFQDVKVPRTEHFNPDTVRFQW
jgi:N-acetylglucosamine-6-sulfatase